MHITATIKNTEQENNISVSTDSHSKPIEIPAKVTGRGSSVNGGELLFLALATCFCNDVYREASKRNMRIDAVEVTVSGQFGKEGQPGSNITYTAKVDAPDHSNEEVEDLITHVDTIAEIHNTLRQGTSVLLKRYF